MVIAGIHLFEDIAWTGMALLFAVYFFGFFVKGAFGLGSLTPTVLFGAWVLDPHHAVVLALVSNAFTQVQFVPEGIRRGDRKITRQILLANYAAAAIGIWIFGRLEGTWLTLVLGLALGAVAIADVGNAFSRLSTRIDLRAPLLIYTLSAAAGLITGVTGAGGLFFVAVYLKLACPDPRVFRATAFLLSMLMVGWRVLLLALAGFVTLQVVLECTILLPPMVLGGFAGTRLFRYLPRERYYQGFQLVLIGAAASLIWKGFGGLD